MDVIGAKYQRGNEVAVKRTMLRGPTDRPQPDRRDASNDACNQPDGD
jgi:hypothetical protein